MHRTKVQSVIDVWGVHGRQVPRCLREREYRAHHRATRKPPLQSCNSIPLAGVAFPISAIVREEIPVPIDPSSVKRVAHPAGKHSVFTGGCVHPKEGCIPLIFFLTNVARGAAVPNQRPIGHDFNGVRLVVSDRNS